ncbi:MULTISPECIES: hypothetical protein [Flavobacterium]|uniref:Lipoprotein n=1 Tax=Flavobacterium jumunjinense TaxID=998845 RepID=A0ABV5GQX2_9FLAO|nr:MULTISPECIES: hypothetical protein [Flavobacterium]
MKIIQYIIFVFLIFASCSQKNNNEKNDTFTLDKVNVAMIYEKKVNDIPCLLFNVTDTIKKNQKIGIIFKLDVKYDNPKKGSNCCAFEPGVDGTKEKIKKIKILFISNNEEIDVTEKLFNIEEAFMFTSFEEYIQGQFRNNDFKCVCYEQKNDELIENLKREHLGGEIIKNKIDKNKTPIIKNINDFVNIYNSLTGDKYNGTFDNSDLYSGWRITNHYYYFWLPEEFNISLKKYNQLEIEVELLKGKKLKFLRVLK